ncbi:MAG: hypothetical protein AVDCRST_MAG64-2220 [uncultured Phycisphaerae bacterium]|uniref:DUF5615 domain-containing protein n=1 Tax=uncultured Phycisphaerae bacterium TaxID=904963 RepID=A0A6J4P9I5_9BACT|nr:MAG: hypothetical protein AVDCRST_MAG64-2220 [uncultured Phycisphaerae bacterium]
MRELLADVNLQGHFRYMCQRLDALDLSAVLTSLNLEVATFGDLGLPRDLDDRALWGYCQRQGWVLFTENRNRDGPDSLEATLADSWRSGHLPVLTLANKGRFEHSREYADRVATDVAELMFDLAEMGYVAPPRIYVPRQ